jgi:hypothetical protein
MERRLAARLREPGAILADDEAVLLRLLGLGEGWDAHVVRHVIDSLVRDGVFRRVWVDDEPHLTGLRVSARSTELPGETSADQVFRLQVALDAEGERALLYRVVIVLEALAALLLAREWLVWILDV